MARKVGLSKTMLVIIALGELGGEADLESIALKAHELFPQVFSWKTRPELPDKDVARAHLSEAKKKTFGQLVVDVDLRKGRGSTGLKRYALTAAGASRARELSLVVKRVGVTGTKTTIDHHRIVDPILSSRAYAAFVEGKAMVTIGRDDFLVAFKLFPDAMDYAVSGRLARAEAAAQSMPDSREKERVVQFIREGRNDFQI